MPAFAHLDCYFAHLDDLRHYSTGWLRSGSCGARLLMFQEKCQNPHPFYLPDVFIFSPEVLWDADTLRCPVGCRLPIGTYGYQTKHVARRCPTPSRPALPIPASPSSKSLLPGFTIPLLYSLQDFEPESTILCHVRALSLHRVPQEVQSNQRQRGCRD